MIATDNNTVDSWVGRAVILWPADTHPRTADVLSVDSFGWEFEITGPDPKSDAPGYRTGDRLYVSHSKPLTMVEQ